MKNLKKISALVLSLSLVLTSIGWVNAAEVSTKFNKTYTETFSDETKVFGDDGIFEAVQNVTDDSVKVVTSNQGGKHLDIISSGNDVQIKTKKGILKHDVTVVDMVISATCASAFPLIRIVNNGVRMDTGNGLFRFVDSGTNIRSYNQVTGNYDTVTLSNGWVNVRVVLDSVNKKITTSFNGSQVTTVSEMADAWNNADVQFYFQAASGSKLSIDDFVVSDGTYSENIYMTQDFEHSNQVNAAVGNGYFYNINKTQNPVVTYDQTNNNTYLNIANAAGNLIYTAWTIDSLNNIAVVELDMRVSAATGSSISLKRNANKAVTPLFTEKELKADGAFHKYRAVVQPLSAGYKVIMFIDNVYVGYKDTASGAYCGADMRLEIAAGAAATDAAIDNINIFYPQAAQIFCDLNGKEDVKVDAVIEMVSNTPINASSAKNAVITENGEAVTFTTSSNSNKNSYIFNIEGGLKKGKTYVISTGNLKDMFEQQYNATITFTTEAEDVIGGEGSLFQFGQNASNANVEYVASAQGGTNLKVTSTNDADVQIVTKKGIFAYPVTVVDMSVRAGISETFPQIKLINNGVKFGNQSMFIFVNNTLRAYDVVNATHKATSSTNEWKNIRIVLDSVNKTITTKINGSEAVAVSNIAEAWDNKNIQFNFQVAKNSSIMIDDVVISDGSFIDGVSIENIYLDYDFEHSSDINKQVGNNFFYNIYKTQNPSVVYDEANNNTYLDITNANGNLIYTNSVIDTYSNSLVVSVDMKATSVSGSSIALKRNANKAITPLFAESDLKADGQFHNYKAVVTQLKRGYLVEKFVDGVSVGFNKENDGAYSGADMRFEITAGAASTDVAIDNLFVYQLPGKEEGTITYTINGEAPVDNKFTAEDTIDVAFNLKSNTHEGAQARGYYAYYDESGEMTFVQFVTLEAEDVYSDTQTVSLDSIPSEVKTVKFFLWTDDVRPLTESVDIVK